MKYLTALILLWVTMWGTGCATTQLETSWRDPGGGSIAFNRVAVVVLNSTPGERRAQEDTLVAEIKKASAVPSYTFVNDNELGNRDLVKQRIVQQGFDGVVVMRLMDSTKQTSYVPGTTSYWYDGWGYAPYAYNNGYYVTDTVVRAEVSLYRVGDGRLLWVGSSMTTNPRDARDLAMQVAQAAGKELRNKGLLQ